MKCAITGSSILKKCGIHICSIVWSTYWQQDQTQNMYLCYTQPKLGKKRCRCHCCFRLFYSNKTKMAKIKILNEMRWILLQPRLYRSGFLRLFEEVNESSNLWQKYGELCNNSCATHKNLTAILFRPRCCGLWELPIYFLLFRYV